MQRTLPALIAVAARRASSPGCGRCAPSPTGAPPTAARANSLGADWRLQQDEVRQGVRQQPLRAARPGDRADPTRARPAAQLDAGLEYRSGRPIYRVRWMTRDGRRIDYLVDAATGAILSGG